MNDTIAAISTAQGVGAISIVRTTGKEAINIVNKIFKGKDLTKVESHTINYGYIIDNNEVIDEVMVSVMKSPKTYTKEDIVEINCHGGITTTNKVFELLLKNGCRLAEPGEFTKRAFLNGRIDLTKAESVMDLINAESESQRKVSIKGIDGYLSKKIKDLRQKQVELLANIEVNIDYPEYEDNPNVTINKILPNIQELKTTLQNLIEKSENGRILTTGIKTAIIGRPNVGKSSILNKLIKEDKAIVTNIAGTTRDTVEGKITIDGVSLNIIDTAGIRDTSDIVEKIGVEKSLNLIEEAELVIAVFNNNEQLTKEDYKIINKIENKKAIIVINKSDLERNIEIKKLKFEHLVYTNTIDSDGIELLEEEISKLFKLNELKQGDYTYLSNARQISLAKQSLESLEDAIESCNNNMSIDLIEIDIKKSWEKLGEIIGESYEEELIDQLFSQFCLGK